MNKSVSGFRIRPDFFSGLILLAIFTFASSRGAQAQWRKQLNDNDILPAGHSEIYFLDLPGPPRIGFAGSYKTTDGGFTWREALGFIVPSDFAFKDSLTGWCAAGQGAFKTTDGGDTWIQLPGVTATTFAVCYDTGSHGLFFSSFTDISGITNWISWDEGSTWSRFPPSVATGFAFNDVSLGVLATDGRYNWQRTTDGGHTWQSVPMNIECWQPLAIKGTKTQFAITDVTHTVLRTNDAWNTWDTVYTFPADPDQSGATTSGCIRGDSNHLYVQLRSGCYLSTDQGSNWKFLCGVPNLDSGWSLWDRRFYAHGPYVAIITDNGHARTDVWMLNVDSMQYFPTGIAFADGTKRTTVQPGTPVTINYSPQTSDPIGIDTGHLVFHYDSNSLLLQALKLPPSWIIVDSSTSGGVLDLRIIDTTGSQLPTPAVQLTFNTYLTTPSTEIYLDSADLSGHRLNCDCQALSIVGPDSVEIDFTSCGDSTILAAMEGQPPFSIESIVPNPAQSEIRLTLSASASYSLFDELGTTRLSGNLSSAPSVIYVTSLPSGSYYLRMTNHDYTLTRKIQIER